METGLTYEQAFAELQKIVITIQDETVTVDQLAEKLKRASELINYCQSRLRSTESEVNAIISKMQNSKKD